MNLQTEPLIAGSLWKGQIVGVEISVYPDNVPLVKFPNDRCPDYIVLRPRSFTEFVGGLFFVDSINWRSPYRRSIPLHLPFIPGARQDRLNDKGDFLFTAKSVANMINERDFSQVVVFDPHSEVSPALINNCKVIKVDAIANEFDKGQDYTAVVSPDAGAEKRASLIAKALQLPLINGWKERDVSDGSIKGFGHNYKGGKGKLLIVDDICDGGGTFIGLGKALKDSGADVDLYVSHGLFSKGTVDLFKIFDNIYTTDSLAIKQDPGVTVIPILALL
jgi:ribose-phosphate pyrophosphokinase